MANLVRLTVTEDRSPFNAGVYSFNCANIKRVYANGTGSIIYYADGTDQKSKVSKLKVSESVLTVLASLESTSGFQIALNVIEIDSVANVKTEYLKTTDILYAIADPSDSSKSWLFISDTSMNKSRYKVNHTLAAVETLANNFASSTFTTPRITDFVPGTGAQLDRCITRYNQYQQAGVLAINVVSIEETGSCTLQIIKTADAITLAVGGTDITTVGKLSGSDDFSTTVGNVDLVTIVKLDETTDNTTGVYYSIKNLG